jgi:4-hydroxy-tetrahydrodipicolinate synthase
MGGKKGFKGIMCLPVTPFTRGDEVDEEALRRITNIIIEDGADALVPTGGTGEFVYLLHEERRRIWKVVLDEANGRVPVLGGTGAVSTKEARMFTQEAKDLGLDGVMLSQPILTRATDEEAYRYFEDIATKVDIPIVVYNNPGIGVSISPGLVARLASNFDNVVSYKEDDFNYVRFAEVIRRTKDKITLFTGSPAAYLAFLTLGAHGALIAEFQAFPHLMKGVRESFERGDMRKALHYHELIMKMFSIIETYFVGVSFPARYKAIWRLRGVDMELTVREPTTAVTPEQLEKAAPEFMKLEIDKVWFRG